MTTLPFMSAGFTSPLLQLLRSSAGIGLPSNAAWLARSFGSSSHVHLSGNSPAKTPSAPKATEQNVMRNDLTLIMHQWLARRSVTATVNLPEQRCCRAKELNNQPWAFHQQAKERPGQARRLFN